MRYTLSGIALQTNQTESNQAVDIAISSEAIFWLIVGILLSLVVGYAIRSYTRYRLRPILSVYSVTTVEEPACTEIVVFVNNEGKRSAENCYGTIEISGLHDEAFKETPELDADPQFTQSLSGNARGTAIWASAVPKTHQSLNREEVRPITIARRRNNRIELPSDGVWSPMACSLEPDQDEMSLTVTVTAKNCDPVRFEVTINKSELSLSPDTEIL